MAYVESEDTVYATFTTPRWAKLPIHRQFLREWRLHILPMFLN
jgi:hypothetical protein